MQDFFVNFVQEFAFITSCAPTLKYMKFLCQRKITDLFSVTKNVGKYF